MVQNWCAPSSYVPTIGAPNGVGLWCEIRIRGLDVDLAKSELWVLINLQLSVGKEATPGDLDLVLEFKKELGSPPPPTQQGKNTTQLSSIEREFYSLLNTGRYTSTYTNSNPTLILPPHVIPHSAKSLILISYHKSTPVGAPIREIAAPHNVFYREWFCLTLTLILYDNHFLLYSIVNWECCLLRVKCTLK